jgi:hypothetical protein
MEREQIIKALECCYDNNLCCLDCPYQDSDKFNECAGLTINALSLIKELTDENESLAKSVNEASDLIRKLRADKKELTVVNERLKKALNTDISIVRVSRGSGKTNHLREVARIRMDAVRADTVNKMYSDLYEEFLKVARCQMTDEPNIRSQDVFDILKRKAKELSEEG